jgi:large subunit ribosomal protein L5
MPTSNNIKKEDKDTKDSAVKPRSRSAAGQSSASVEPKQKARKKAVADVSASVEPKQKARKKAVADVSAQEAEKPVRRMPRLLDRYRKEILPTMVQEFGYKSPLETPKVQRIVLNIGLGEALLNANALESAKRDLTLITGQMPVITRAHKSIAGFKIRQGMGIGMMVTLRGSRMYDFLDKLINAVLPRIRDFRGVSKTSFDGRGNYSLGLREQASFPEIDYNNVDRLRGLQITIVTSAHDNGEGFRLLELMGMPFTREGLGR